MSLGVTLRSNSGAGECARDRRKTETRARRRQRGAISAIQALTLQERAVLWATAEQELEGDKQPSMTLSPGQQVYNALHAGDEEENHRTAKTGDRRRRAQTFPTISLPRLDREKAGSLCALLS